MKLKVISLMCLTAFTLVSHAETNTQKTTTKLDFEDELVDGSVKNPDLEHILTRQSANHGRLIKLRDNFLPEMDQSAKTVKHSNR